MRKVIFFTFLLSLVAALPVYAATDDFGSANTVDNNGDSPTVDSNATNNTNAYQKTKKTLSDAAITSSVKTNLLASSDTSGLKIHVKTKNGIVTLTGEAKTQEEKVAAGNIAANTDGVVKVRNHIKVVR